MSKERQWKETHNKVMAWLNKSDEESSMGGSTENEQSFRDDSSMKSIVDNVDDVSRRSESSYEESGTESDCESSSDSSYHSEISPISSESDDNIFVEDELQLSQKLAKCAISNGWTRKSVNELLVILREEQLDLPKDARTLLKTPREMPVMERCGGNYIYFGIQRGIERLLDSVEPREVPNVLKLKFNIDGLPIFRSSGLQIWPILASIKNFDIFIVALFSGTSKPNSLEDYSQDFVVELQHLMENGFYFNERYFKIEIHSFICDAPARAFLKSIINHNGYYACERCLAPGESYERRIVYHDSEDFPKRSHFVFRDFGYNENHQVEESILSTLEVNMIDQFPIDYMHLVCLGVVRRILNYLKKGPAGKISARHIDEISLQLVSFNGCMPSEFSRQPRSMRELDRWKATEFRQFLLYTGPVALRGIVNDDVYNHFMALSVSISFLLQENDDLRSQYLDYSEALLKQFVSNAKFIYGFTFTVYNVHHLIHLPDDCRFFGTSLNNISCFDFENFLQRLKRSVRGKTSPIVQIAKRQEEFEEVFANLSCNSKSHKISSSRKDMCFMNEEKNGIFFVKEVLPENHVRCEVIRVKYLNDVFTVPISSRSLNIYLLEKRNRKKIRTKILDRAKLAHKCVCLNEHRGYAIFPLLHKMKI